MKKLLEQLRAIIMRQRKTEAEVKKALFKYLSNEHDILPLDSDLNEIIQIVKSGN